MSFTFSSRDLAIVVGAKAVSLLGDQVATIALVLLLQERGAGGGAVAALLMANLVPILLLSAPVGRLVDRRDNRTLLVASGSVQAALCTGLAFVSAPWAVLTLVALLGAGQAVTGATWQALLPAVVPPERLATAASRSQLATTAAFIVAPALGGVLAGAWGSRVPLLIDAATFVLVALAALGLRTRRRPAAATGERMRGGLAIVAANPLLRAVLFTLGASALLGSAANVIEVFLVRETLHAGGAWFGVAGAALATGLFVGAAAGGRLRSGVPQRRAFVVSAGALSASLIAMGLAPDIGWLLVFAFCCGAGNGVLNVCTTVLVMGATAPAERGRIGALTSGLVSAAQLGAYAVAGALAGELSPRTIFVLAGVAGLLPPVTLGWQVLRAKVEGSGRSVAVEAALV